MTVKSTLFILIALFAVQFTALASQKLTINETNTCQWYFNNTLVVGETDNSIVLTATGNYTAVYQNLAGETVKSTTFYNASTGQKVKLYVIGDSTASKYDASRYPRTGWAQVFQPFFNSDSVLVVDKAISGRSSKSFYTDGAGWPVVKPALSAGDYLFIQFGHNDAKSDEERHTDPYTTYKEYLKRYIDEARARGAIPVLLTPIHRNGWNGALISNSHGDYPAAMRQLAFEEDVPLIDLTAKTAALFEAYGQDVVSNQFFNNIPPNVYATYPEGNSDNTHLQERGAYEVAKLVSNAFAEQHSIAEISKLYRSSVEAGIIKVDINSYGLGTVSGTKVKSIGAEVTLKANAKSGFVFSSSMSDNDVVSTEANYTFTVTDSLLFLKAFFIKGYKVSLGVTPKYKARVTGSGTYAQGDSVTVVVKPYTNYDFDYWTVNEAIVGTDSTYSFVMDTTDVELVAVLKEEGATDIINNTAVQVSVRYVATANKILVSSSSVLLSIALFDINGKKVKTVSTINNPTAHCKSWRVYPRECISPK